MRLKVSRSKNAASLYVTKTIYEGKKQRTITVEKLGTEKELLEKLNGKDPYEWAKQYIAKLNQEEKQQNREIILKFVTMPGSSPAQTIMKVFQNKKFLC